MARPRDRRSPQIQAAHRACAAGRPDPCPGSCQASERAGLAGTQQMPSGGLARVAVARPLRCPAGPAWRRVGGSSEGPSRDRGVAVNASRGGGQRAARLQPLRPGAIVTPTLGVRCAALVRS